MFKMISNLINNIDQSLNKDKLPLSSIILLALIVLMIAFSLLKKNHPNNSNIASNATATQQAKNMKSN